MFNNAGITDEENSPTVSVSEEAGGESEHSETEHEPSEASKNHGKEPGIYFTVIGFFAFNLIYLDQYLSAEVIKKLGVLGMVLTNPIL